MSEEEPGAHRPRRAWREEPTTSNESETGPHGADAGPDEPEPTARAEETPEAVDPTDADESSDSGESTDTGESSDSGESTDTGEPADPGEPADGDATASADETVVSGGDVTAVRPSAPSPADSDDEDAPRPLYRDESEHPTSPSSAVPRTGDSPDPSSPDRSSPNTADLSDETTILSRARERKRSQSQHDPDETTLLPRTAAGARVQHRDDADDDEDFDDANPHAARRRLMLMIGAVAVVAVLGLLAGYALIKTTTQPVAAPGPTTSTEGTGTDAPSGSASSADATALVTEAMMLSPTQAETLDSKRTWKVALDQRGTSGDSQNHPACLSSDTTEGGPVPQQTVLRLLSSSGSDSPAALHQATAYATPEEAAQAYATASRALGDCAMSGAWIDAGHQVSGVGDQAVGVTLQVLDGDSLEYRTVVLTRTGRVVDVIDVAKPDKAVTAKRVTEVAGDVVDTQCQAAGGSCSDEPETADAPPPLGGDQPGFLASADLPPMGPELTRWAGTTPGEPDADLLRGSGCEVVDWSKVDAEARSHRTYLLSDSSSKFGLDEVIITTEDEAAATKLAEKVRDGWESCGKRQLTATVADIKAVSGAGAKSTEVKGWTTEVSQKADDKTSKYRVGIVSGGTKVAFVFLNPQQDLDLTADQFDTVSVRAGQRATQVN